MKYTFMYILIIISSSAYADKIRLDVGLTKFPPYTLGEEKNFGIYEKKIFKIFKDSGYQIRRILKPYIRNIQDFNKGKIDGVVLTASAYDSLVKDKVRMIKADFHTLQVPLYFNNEQYKLEQIDKSKLSDFKGKHFATIINSPSSRLLTQNGSLITELASHVSMYKMLEEKRVDFVPMPKEIGNIIVEKNNLSKVSVSNTVFLEEKVYIVFRKKNKDFNKKIENIVKKSLIQ